VTTEHSPNNVVRVAKKAITNYGIVFALIAIIALFSILRPQTFPTVANFGSILQANSSIVFIAFGLMLPLIAGHFDLSVAAMAGFGGVFATGLMSKGTVESWPTAVLLVICIAVVVGLINGLLVAYVKLNALVVTLGTQSVLFGMILLYTNGAVIYEGIPQSFKDLGQSRPFGVPLPFLYVIVVGIMLWYLLYYRPIGRQLYAIGGSEDAARLTGIRVDPMIVGAFVCGSVLAAIGGCIQVAQVGSAAPTSGSEFLLPAIAACFLGETSIRRGYYNVWGTMTAVVLVAAGTTGLFMLGAQPWVQPVFNGVVLVGAILAAKLGLLKLRGRKAMPSSAKRTPSDTALASTPS
jgi:ribose transport system permease protein